MDLDKPCEYNFTFAVVGDPNVGKSSLISKFTFDMADLTSKEYKIKTVEVDGELIKLQIKDFNMASMYNDNHFYRGAQAIFVVFDLSDLESWRNIRQWMREIDRYGNDSAFRIIVGNKLDLCPRLFKEPKVPEFSPPMKVKTSEDLNSISKLPEEVLINIFSYLELQSTVCVMLVNWHWCRIANDNQLWYLMCKYELSRRFSNSESVEEYYQCNISTNWKHQYYLHYSLTLPISYREIKEYADSLGISFIFTSSKTGENLPELFFKTARAVKERILDVNTSLPRYNMINTISSSHISRNSLLSNINSKMRFRVEEGFLFRSFVLRTVILFNTAPKIVVQQLEPPHKVTCEILIDNIRFIGIAQKTQKETLILLRTVADKLHSLLSTDATIARQWVTAVKNMMTMSR